MMSLARRIAVGKLNQLLVPTKHVDKMSKTADDIPVSPAEISSDPVQHRPYMYHNTYSTFNRVEAKDIRIEIGPPHGSSPHFQVNLD